MITDTLVKYGAIAGLIVLGGLSAKLGYEKHRINVTLTQVRSNAQAAETAYASERTTLANALSAMTANYRAAEQALAAQALELKKARDAAEKQTALAAASVRERLRLSDTVSRLRTAAQVPGAPAAPVVEPYPAGSFGALLGGAAEPLAGDAQRSDVLKGFLIECRGMYEAAQASLRALTSQ